VPSRATPVLPGITMTMRVVAACALAAALMLSAASWARADGDPAKGEQIYHRCQGCHSIDRNRVGPMHKGLFGRTAGSVPGFSYSDAMKNSRIVWSEQTLDQFLQGPRKMVPGTKMTYAGLRSEQQRIDLLAFLRAQSDNPLPIPPPQPAKAAGPANAPGSTTGAETKGATPATPAKGATPSPAPAKKG